MIATDPKNINCKKLLKGTGIAAMAIMKPELIMKSIIPVVMAGENENTSQSTTINRKINCVKFQALSQFTD